MVLLESIDGLLPSAKIGFFLSCPANVIGGSHQKKTLGGINNDKVLQNYKIINSLVSEMNENILSIVRQNARKTSLTNGLALFKLG